MKSATNRNDVTRVGFYGDEVVEVPVDEPAPAHDGGADLVKLRVATVQRLVLLRILSRGTSHVVRVTLR